MTSSSPVQTEIEFNKLESLVELLALRCHDEVDNVCFLSSQAAYQLYRILLQQKGMDTSLTTPHEAPSQGFPMWCPSLPHSYAHLHAQHTHMLSQEVSGKEGP